MFIHRKTQEKQAKERMKEKAKEIKQVQFFFVVNPHLSIHQTLASPTNVVCKVVEMAVH